MIVLDTNVLSELLRPAPEQRVLTWLSAQPRGSVDSDAAVAYADIGAALAWGDLGNAQYQGL